MRGSVGRSMLDCPVAQSAKIQAAKERLSLAEHDRGNCEMNFIDVAGLNVLPYSLDAAADF
jgi:hypothetical protein